jgi:hypothetical protein
VADVYLQKDVNEVERTVAQKNVVIVQPNRRGTGDWCQYTTADEVAVLTGNPAHVEDVEQGITEGNRVTMYRRENRVTVDDIERVARFYLKPDAVSVVLVGNASVFVPQLRGVGFGKYETIPVDSLDLLTADFKKGGPAGRIGRTESPALVLASYQQPDKPVAPVVAEEGAKAKALLDRVIAAKGGLAALAGIKSLKAETSTTMMAPEAPGAGGPRNPGSTSVEVETTTYLQYPDRVRVETKAPQGVQIQVYDGEHGWVRDPGGVHPPGLGVRLPVRRRPGARPRWFQPRRGGQ